MSNNQGQPEDTRTTMSDDEIELSVFTKLKINELMSAMDEVMKGPGGSSSQRTKIQRVPPVLSNMKEDFTKCFEPRMVALGPLHHGNPKFYGTEQTKLEFAAFFMLGEDDSVIYSFRKVLAEIKDLRECYDPVDIERYTDEELAWMLFIDGCAVLCAMQMHCGYRFGRAQDSKFNAQQDFLVFAHSDLFLLENQIPYRVLMILIETTGDPRKWEYIIAEFIAQNVITNIRGRGVPPESQYPYRKDYAHLLERLREEHLSGREETKDSSWIGRILMWCGCGRKHKKTFHSIEELKNSGIHVKPTKTGSLKNINFSCNFMGELRIPPLMVDDSTASKLLNLIALEMCPDFDDFYGFVVTRYLSFLDSLINTADDVKELKAAGVLHNYLGCDEEVADLINKISRDLVPDQRVYGGVSNHIRIYCNNPCTPWVAQGYNTYFSSPWTFIVFLGAFLGLLFTAIQTYFSLPSSREKPPSS